MAPIAVRGHEFHRVSRSSISGDTGPKSSYCLREVSIILNKSTVHRYLNAKRKSTNSSVEKVKKQTKLPDYLKNNKIIDNTSLNRNEAVIEEKINTPSSESCNNIFHDIDNQASVSTKSNENSNYSIKTEQSETANEICMDEYCYDNLDVGAEFKYSEFLSESNSPQVDVVNEQAIEVTHDKENSKDSPKSLAKKKKYFHCDHCDLQATQKSILATHIRTKHSQLHDESGFITCVECGKKLSSLYYFKAHKRTCGSKLYMSCQFCRKKVLLFDDLKRHVINHHPNEFGNKMELNEILQWCMSRPRVRMAPIRQKSKMQKSNSLKHLNYSMKQSINMFCSKCNVISERTVGKHMIQCLKCETTLLFQCKKCKKTFERMQPTLTHIKLCESKEDDLIVDRKNKVLKIIDKQTSSNSTDMCNSLKEESVNPQPLQVKSEIFMNESQDFRCGHDLNAVNEKDLQGIDVNEKLYHTWTSIKKAAQTPGIKPFQCDYCGHRVKQKLWLERHIEHKHSELFDENGIITCTKCDKKYRTLGKFNFHKRICGTKIYFPCKFCSKLLSTFKVLKMHIMSQHEKEFKVDKFYEILEWSKCRSVRKVPNQGKSINAHIPMKKKLFRSYFDLNKLIKIFCSKCNVTSERELGKNKIRCMKCDTALKFQCQMCKNTYDKSGSLRVHMKWYCKAREINSNGNIIRVASNNSIDKQQPHNSNFNNLYTAPVPKGSSLKKKIENLYCNDCDYQTDKKHRLVHHIRFKHILTCDKEGSFICPKCQKKFKHSRSCTTHQLVCNATFKYKCTFCKYTAKQSEPVKRHIRLKHADKIEDKNLDDITNEILKNRKNVKEQYEAKKLNKLLVKNEDLSECFDLRKVIKMICQKCHVVTDRMKYQTVKYCSKCEKLLEYQCQRCGQTFDKYPSVWRHMKRYCRMIKKQ